MSDALRARLSICAAAALFSTGGAAIKACSLSSWQVASFRSGVAALTLAFLLPSAAGGIALRSLAVGAAYATTMILFVAGNKLTTAANTIFLQSAAPLYVLLLSPWLLNERRRRRDLGFMAAIVAGLGLLFIGTPAPALTAPDPARGNMLAAIAGVSWSLTIIGLRSMGKQAAEGERATSAALIAGNVLTFAVCLPAALPVTITASDAAIVFFLGAVQIALSYRLMSAGFRHVPAVEASLLLLLEPVLNPVWAWLVHGETPGLGPLAGGATILAATALKTWRDTRPDVLTGQPLAE